MEGLQDTNLETKDFQKEIVRLEQEKRKMREEFDVQRAKMKELFLQKEDELLKKKQENDGLNKEQSKLRSELDEIRSQLLVADMQLESNVADEKRKAAEEIASLQQLVHETVEESSSSQSIFDNEMRKMHQYISRLEQENTEMRNEKQSPHHNVQETSSLAPSVVLSAVTKKLAKKLGADAFTSQEDDHREDTELLKSLVGPLEEEIKALKHKLRATDEQLQKCKHCSQEFDEQSGRVPKDSPLHSAGAAETARAPTTCDMCSNYEAQLVRQQKRCSDLEGKVSLAEKSVERHREDLLKEIGFRKDMEEKWNEKREEHKKQVAELTTRIECSEQDMKELQEAFEQACDEMKQNLSMLTADRQKVQLELDRLQKENDHLVGKYTVHSQQMQSEVIDLPATVEELQELLLKSQQDLILEKMGKEAAKEETNDLRSDVVLLNDQIGNMQQHAQALLVEIENLKHQKHAVEIEHQHYAQNLDKHRTQEKDAKDRLKEAETELDDYRKRKRQLDEKNDELRIRIASLQQELDTSEAVQKDFVLLSQSLQVQLEKIRDADAQVRWQHDEDVDDCPQCRSAFASSKRKDHCKHCGQIFCSQCLSHTVLSGPHQRPSKVCDVCHTLLVKSSAPYFSTEAPHSPD